MIYISVQNTNCQPLVRVIIGHVFSRSIAGVQLFGGKFYKCVDGEGAKLSHTVVTNKTHCQALSNMSYSWVNSKINFDNVLNGYLALFQVVSHTCCYSILPSIILEFGKSLCGRLKFNFRENHSHGELQTRPMCCSEPDDVPFIFEFVRMWSNYRIKRLLCGVHYAFYANVML